MVDRFELGREFFAQLEQEDEKIAREVAPGSARSASGVRSTAATTAASRAEG
jgi:hypothetical protein